MDSLGAMTFGYVNLKRAKKGLVGKGAKCSVAQLIACHPSFPAEAVVVHCPEAWDNHVELETPLD
jgi:hypothetical protein